MTFADYITSHLTTPFEWGKFDCILFAFGWVKHATGTDYVAGIPPWNSAMQAMRLVEELGGIEAILDERFARINPNFAVDGDLAVYQGAVHLFNSAHIVSTGETGLVHTNRMKADSAWSLSKPIYQPVQRAKSRKEQTCQW